MNSTAASSQQNPFAFGLRMICADFRRKSSPPMREKYPVYDVDVNVVKGEITRFKKADSSSLTYVDILLLVNRVVDIRPLVREVRDDNRIMGQLLRRCSYVACSFGGTASRGDVEFYLRRIHACKGFPEEAVSPLELLEAFECGERLYLLSFLYMMLEHAQELLRERGFGDTCSIFTKHAHGWEMEAAVLSSQFHLLQSLIRYVEPTGGHA